MSTRRGFTLIELLVVIAIIALLVSILLPSLARARLLANNVRCQTNQHGIARAVHMYAAENNDIFPRDGMGDWGSFTYVHLSPYCGGPEFEWHDHVRHQSTDAERDRVIETVYSRFAGTDIYKCPSISDPEWVLAYVVNSNDFAHAAATGGAREGGGIRGFDRLSTVPHPQTTALSVEVNMDRLGPRDFGGFNIWNSRDLPFTQSGDVRMDGRMISGNDMRHGGRTTIAFFDGHMEARELKPGNFTPDFIAPGLRW